MVRIRTISCAYDTDLAKKIHAYLLSRHEVSQSYQEYAKDDPFSSCRPEHILLVEDEITFRKDCTLTVDAAMGLLRAFIDATPELMEYSITESIDTLIISKVLTPAEMGNDGDLLTCEFCGYFTPYWKDLFNHKKMHAVYSKSH